MSISAVRNELVTTLSAVPGLIVYPRLPKTTGALTAWPAWHGLTPGAIGRVCEWRVWVILGQSLEDAEAYLDDILAPLLDGVGTVITVSAADMVSIAVAGSDIYVLEVAGFREFI